MDFDFWQVSAERGFLPICDPLNALPADFPGAAVLEETAASLPDMVGQPAALRARLAALPMVDADALARAGVPVQERLLLLYAFLASAYVHLPPTATHLPVTIARPLAQVAAQLQRPPMLSYAGMVLGNWQRIDPDGPLDLENLRVLNTFSGLPDEAWFFLVHVAIEAQAAQIIGGMQTAFEAAQSDSPQHVLEGLRQINRGIVACIRTFNRMPHGCNPDVYYCDIRPYMFGFNNVVFEGVDDNKPQNLRGGSGAQSSLIPALVAGLGVTHAASELTRHLEVMKTYMPPTHCQYIANIDSTRIRGYVATRPPLADAYNACLRQLITFRRAHFYYARTYIFEKSTNPVGTGGTSFMDFLANLVRETQAHLL